VEFDPISGRSRCSLGGGVEQQQPQLQFVSAELEPSTKNLCWPSSLPPLPHVQDLENTTGSWDVYGQDSDKRYNGLQVRSCLAPLACACPCAC